MRMRKSCFVFAAKSLKARLYKFLAMTRANLFPRIFDFAAITLV